MNIDFIELCKPAQKKIKEMLVGVLREYGYDPVAADGFIYAKGDGKSPILLTAHMDTVHKEQPRNFVIEEGKLSSPQGIGGDDRCGIWIILQVLDSSKYRPSILFCEDEEIGGKGSEKFCATDYLKDLTKLKFLVQIDRHGSNDAVYYDCDNTDFADFIYDAIGYRESWGTFSDISNLAPTSAVAAVNLSCGYYNEHTLKEYVVLQEMEDTYDAVIKLIELSRSETVPQFEYIEAFHSYSGWGSYISGMYIYANDVEDYVQCDTIDEGFGRFLRMYPTLTYNDIYDYEIW